MDWATNWDYTTRFLFFAGTVCMCISLWLTVGIVFMWNHIKQLEAQR